MLQIDLAGESLTLLAERALWWPAQSTLLIADAHFGKGLTFRARGVAVPSGTSDDTMDRLAALLDRTGAARVVFLGDLLHSARAQASATLAAVQRWRDQHAQLELVLVRGNHDRHAGDPPADWGVQAVEEPLHLGSLALMHHPRPVSGAYVLAGHLHPCAVLGGRAHDRLRLPCFHFGPAVGVLPAFGEFTGMHALPRAPGDRVFVVQGDAVLPLPA